MSQQPSVPEYAKVHANFSSGRRQNEKQFPLQDSYPEYLESGEISRQASLSPSVKIIIMIVIQMNTVHFLSLATFIKSKVNNKLHIVFGIQFI